MLPSPLIAPEARRGEVERPAARRRPTRGRGDGAVVVHGGASFDDGRVETRGATPGRGRRRRPPSEADLDAPGALPIIAGWPLRRRPRPRRFREGVCQLLEGGLFFLSKKRCGSVVAPCPPRSRGPCAEVPYVRIVAGPK